MNDFQRTPWPNMGISAQDYDPMDFAKLKAGSFNKTTGNLTGTDCPVCLNKGNIMVPREDGSLTSQECSCMTMRRCVWRMERSGLKNVIRNYTFGRFEATEDWQKKILESATEYAQNPDGWFLICGQSGSGKSSHLYCYLPGITVEWKAGGICCLAAGDCGNQGHVSGCRQAGG